MQIRVVCALDADGQIINNPCTIISELQNKTPIYDVNII